MNLCPKGFFCFDRYTLILLIGAVIFVVIYQNYIFEKKFIQENQKLQFKEQSIKKKIQKNSEKLNNINNYIDVMNHTENIDYERITNPLLPPERTHIHKHLPINIPTRGYSSHYQQVGSIHEKDSSNDTKKILPLYGRPYYPGSRQWNYYTQTDSYSPVKISVYHKQKNCQDERGCDEIYDGNDVTLNEYPNKTFVATIYNLDKPRYIPHVF